MIPAYAKVNLRLKVINKRPDHYHNLEMINIRVDLADYLSIKKDNSGDISISTNHPNLPTDEHNILYRISQYFKETFLIKDGLHIYIDKHIPIGAGLGGGSCDGASLIRWFNDEYQLNLTDEQLIGLAVQFGADVPYGLFTQPAKVWGIGDKIEFINLELPHYLLLVTPPIMIATKAIFGEYDQLKISSNHQLKPVDVTGNIYELMENDLEKVTLSIYPQIREYLQALISLGAGKVIMSGSGPSFFCLVDNLELGKEMLSGYQNHYPNHFSVLTKIINNKKNI